MDVFQEAAKAAQRRYGTGWFVLSPQEQTRSIYEEMRRIDVETATTTTRPEGTRKPGRKDPTLAA